MKNNPLNLKLGQTVYAKKHTIFRYEGNQKVYMERSLKAAVVVIGCGRKAISGTYHCDYQTAAYLTDVKYGYFYEVKRDLGKRVYYVAPEDITVVGDVHLRQLELQL